MLTSTELTPIRAAEAGKQKWKPIVDRRAPHKKVYSGCLADIESVSALFDENDRCLDIARARTQIGFLKGRLSNVIREFKESEVESIVREALNRHQNGTSSSLTASGGIESDSSSISSRFSASAASKAGIGRMEVPMSP